MYKIKGGSIHGRASLLANLESVLVSLAISVEPLPSQRRRSIPKRIEPIPHARSCTWAVQVCGAFNVGLKTPIREIC